jgi:dTDP-glucose 4,6-dehydratase
MKIFVTGGAGFIGSNFVRMALMDKLPDLIGCEITVFDALTYSGTMTNLTSVMTVPNFTFIRGDIRDSEAVAQALPGHDAIMHFAAESHVDRSVTNSRIFVDTNVLGTQTLLDQALELGINRFVHVSTDEVYGSIEEGSWDESQSLLPNSPYSASKAASDLLVRSYNVTHGLNTSITRCSNNYGTHHFPEKVIPLFITNLLDGLRVPLYGDGQNIRDWLHVDDHCRGLARVLADGRAGEIYNIGGGTELSNVELTQMLLGATGRDQTFVERVSDRKGHDRRYSVNIEKISAELGYEPLVDFPSGLADVVTWYEENRSWWEPLKDRAHL